MRVPIHSIWFPRTHPTTPARRVLTMGFGDRADSQEGGEAKERIYAASLIPVIKNKHWLLVTLLLCNAAASMSPVKAERVVCLFLLAYLKSPPLECDLVPGVFSYVVALCTQLVTWRPRKCIRSLALSPSPDVDLFKLHVVAYQSRCKSRTC